MKQYLTEFDELQAALKKVRIDENVMPYHMGRLVEDEDSYNKIQKLLDCPQMAGSHRYLYDLDVENLQEGEIDKINQLFDLGVKKGYIDNSFEEEFEKEENPDAVIADEPESRPACGSVAGQKFSAPVPCWTILYSATKNGEIKSGECYSNAVSVSAAKADCLAKLAKFGYENVAVLAIEAGDPDMCGATDVNENGVKEDDMLKNRAHNLHKVDERFDPDKGMTYNDYEVECMYEISPRGNGGMVYSDSYSGIVEGASVKSMIGKAMAAIAEEEGVELGDVKIIEFNSAYLGSKDITDDANRVLTTLTESGKNPYIAGMKVVTGGKVSTAKPAAKKTSKKLKEDDGDTGGEDAEDEGSDDAEGEDTESDDTEGSEDEGSDDAEGEDTEGDDTEGSEDEGGEELDDSKKAQYKNEYRRIFQEVMAACKFNGKSFNDLTIDEKVKFFTKLKERWTKADPKEFMSDKEQDQLESITIDGESTEGSDDTESEDTEGSDDTEGSEDEGSEDEGSDDTESEDTEGSDDTEGEDTEGSDAGGDEADGEDESSGDESSDDEGSDDEGSDDESSEDEGSEDEDIEGEE